MTPNFKRLLALLLSAIMVFGMMPTMAFAAEDENAGIDTVATGNVAMVGNTEYATIDEAIAAWTNNTTLTLLADVTLSDVIKLSSKEYHILDLGTYTMTAASKKDAIQIVNDGLEKQTYALDIKADATNPGGITATGKSVVIHSGSAKDRPITRFYGGVFNGSNIVKHSGNNGSKSPSFYFYGGVYNGTISTNRSTNLFYGGTFNGSLSMSVDSSAYTLISGGRFKYLSNSLMRSELNSGKFTIGSSKGVYDRGIYVDSEGYYVITGEVITSVSNNYPASYTTSYSETYDYFYYSAAATYGLFYEDADMAIAKHGAANVTIYEKPAVTIPETLTGEVVDEIKNNTALKGYTPENLPAGAELVIELVSAGEKIVYDVTPMADGVEVDPTEAITFRLPIPASVTDTFAKVYHENETKPMAYCKIQGDGTAKYIEISSDDFSEFAVETITPTKGYYLTIYNADGTVGMPIDGTKSVSEFSLKSSIADARVFADNGFLFGITGPATYVIDMFEDSTEDESFEIGSDVTINGNGHKIVLADDVVLTNNGTLNDVTIQEPAPKVAKIGDVKYATLEEAFAAAAEGETITLLADATPALKSQRAITKAAVIDLNGKTLTLTEDDLYFGTTTFKNGTIVVDPSVKPSTAVFWMFANQTLTFDNVKLVATGVTGTYLIGLEGTNSDLNLLNGSEILVENTTALDLDIICVNGSSDNDIVINNSKVNVTNLDGRVFFRGNYTVSGNTEIALEGITKAGFRIEAGQTLSIEDTANVTIIGEPRDGGINLTDLTATYTKADTATVNATVNAPAAASVNGVKYTTLADALAAAQAGDEVVLLADVTLAETLTAPAGITINGNGKQINGELWADGNLTFVGYTKVTNFNAGYNKPIITIGEGATLELTGSGRMVIGHGCTFNIEGTITDAKTVDKATLTPSLVVAAGASFTGTNLTFNVKNAYVKFNANSTSKNSNANGTFNFNVTNSIWEQTGVLAFYVPTSGMDPTFNLNLKDSVLTTTSHLVFSVTKGDIVIDNSNVNVGASNQIENRSTMTIKNGSVVNGAVATSSNAKNPGTVIVENATYAVTGEFTGSDLGTGTLTIKNGANVTIGNITKANIVIDATDMTAGELPNFTANLASLAGTIEVINNDKLEAKIVDGKIVLSAKPVAMIGEIGYATIAAAIAAAQDGDTVVILPGEYGAINISNKNITIKGTVGDNGELLTVIKGGNPAITGHGFNGTIKDLKIVDAFKVMYAEPAGNVTVDNVYVSGATYGFHLVAYSKNLTWTIQDSYMDLSWANSFGVAGEGDANIVIKDNVFASTNPYYPDYGALPVNTFMPKLTVEGNVFGENTKIKITGASNASIKENYHADGVENAFAGDSEKVDIDSYYTDAALTNLVYAPKGSNGFAYTGKDENGYVRVWGEGGGNASESFELKLYSGETLIATTTLNNVGDIIDGDVYVTWYFFYPNSNDAYWTTVWEDGHPRSDAQPTHVKLIIDGTVVATTDAKMSGADGINPVNWKDLGGVKYICTGLKGSGTAEDPYIINRVEELLWFQAKVDEQAADGSTQFAGKYFKLTSNIDLAGINWNPIGSKTGDHASFKGVFDGDGHTISNLYVEQAGEGLGLFAYTSGNAVIKNLKLENVTVKSTNNSNYVGGLIGNAYASTKIENVHISGDVYISGRGYVGGIAGHGYVVMDNVSVKANAGGLITSTFWCAGGILGYAGEGSTNITNAHVEGLTITSAAGGLGAIVGMAEDNDGTQPISGSNLSAKNVVIKTYVGGYGTAYEDYAMGYLYGGSEISKLTGNLTVENVTVKTASGNPATVVDADALVNDKPYFDFAAAFAAAQDGDVVTLLKDYTGDIAIAKSITLAGEVTVNGRISINADGATLKGLTVKNPDKKGDYDCAVSINAKNVTIDGCDISGYNGLRYCYTTGTVTFKNSKISGENFTIHFDGYNGGEIVIDNCEITGWCSFAADIKKITIKDSEFAKGNSSGIRLYQTDITIEDCTFEDGMKIDLATKAATVKVTNSGDAAKLFNNDDILNSTITVDAEKLAIVATATVKNAAGKYETIYFKTLQDAIDYDYPAGTRPYINLKQNIVLTAPVVIPAGKTLAITGTNKNYVISYTSDKLGEAMIVNYGDVIFDACTVTYKYTGAADSNFHKGNYTIENRGILTIQDATVQNLSEQNTATAVNHMYCAIQQAGGTVTITGSKSTVTTNNYRSIRVNKGDLIIENGTFNGQIWLQPNQGDATITVTGGTFAPAGADGSSIFMTNEGEGYTVTSAKISGGTFTTKIGATNPSKLAGAITGGKFSATAKDNTNAALIATGCVFGEADANGYYAVVDDPATHYIYNLDDLKAFRDAVNAGTNYYKGVTVYLMADIDLAGENWVGIGSAYKDHGFMGNFDGNGYKIMNLTITNPAVDADGYAYAGLFSVTEGTDKDNQNFVKNLIIENVTISTTGHIVAAAIAYPYYTIVENITVCGDIAINGGDYTAGALAYTRRCVNASNVTVAGNAGSTITGKQVVGGVISDIQMNGGLTANYSNFSVSGVTITGTKNVGGISGIICNQTLDGATVKNVTLVCSDARVGIVAGSLGGTSTISNVTTSNVTGATAIVGAAYDSGYIVVANGDVYTVVEPVAKIGTTYYATLAEAIAAAQDDDTIVLLADIEMSEGITNTKKVTLDLNGKTITGTDNATGSFGLITNKGELTITGNGTITLKATNNRGWGAYSSVISNQPGGKLTVNGGTIEHLGGTDMAYGIDNLTNGKGTYAETVINGGTVKSTYRAIRQFLNGIEAQNILTVNGGTIEGANKAIWMQDPSKNANTGTITVAADAVIKGNVYFDVTEGSTEWPVEISVAAAALKNGSTVITDNVPAGYVVENINGIYTVSFKPIMVTYPVGNPVYPEGKVEYYDDMLSAVPYTTNCPRLEGATITLLDNVSGAGMRFMENDMVFDLNGFTYTITAGTGSQGTNTSGFQIRPEVTTNVTFKNGTIKVAEGAPVVWMFNCYATNFVVENVTVDCTNMAWSYGSSFYVVVARDGDNVEFIGNTKIENFNAEVAGTAYSVGGTMTIGDNVVAGGIVELDAGAKLTAAEDTDVVTVDGYMLVYSDGTFTSVKIVAKIGDVAYATITEAIKAAQSGDVVEILPGTYDEVIEVKRLSANITIKGAAGFATTLKGGITLGDDGNIVDTGKVTIEGIKFTGKGVNLYSLAGVTVTGNQFSGITELAAIYVQADNYTENVVITNNVIDGVSANSGIRVRSGENVTITGNTVNDTRDSSILLEGNTAANNGTVVITNNVLSNWAQSTNNEGRAIRISTDSDTASKTITIEENTMMAAANAFEEYVKITGNAATISVDKNYWDGEDPTAEGILNANTQPTNYYTTYENGVRGGLKGLLTGKGTEADPYLIKSVADLILFRDSVNAGETKYNADGVYVALAADIDLKDVNWSVNIGDDCNATFDGIFDGQNYTISNLNSTETAQKADGYICTGLFGAIAGNAVIKNLTINNVDINTGDYVGNNVAAVVGFAYNASGSIENVKVTGDIIINAKNATGVGVILGYDYYSPALVIKNCVVGGNIGSGIVGKAYVGGIVGYASNKINISNNTVSYVDIKAAASVGGIAGIMLAGGTATGNTVKYVTLMTTGAKWKNSAAAVVGTITNGYVTVSGTTVTNVTANYVDAPIVGGILVEQPSSEIKKVEAKIGDKYYTTFALAYAAMIENDTIVLLDNVTLADVVAVDKAFALDLNNNTITGEFSITNADATITAPNTLTVTTTVATSEVKYADGKYSVVEKVASGTIRAIEATLLYEDIISMRFLFTMTGEFVNNGILVFNNKSDAENFDIAKAAQNRPLEYKSGQYYGYTDGIPAKEMGNSVYIVGYLEFADGTYAFSQIVEYSPMIYAQRKVVNGSEETKALCKALMQYGAAAQTFMNYNTGNLMNAGFEAVPFDVNVLGEEKFVYQSGNINGFTIKEANMLFEGAISYRFKYQVDSSLADKALYMEYTVKGETKIVELVAISGYYYGYAADNAAKDMDELIVARPFYYDANNEKVYGGSITYSGYEYARRMTNSSTATAAGKALAQAFAMYINAANSAIK